MNYTTNCYCYLFVDLTKCSQERGLDEEVIAETEACFVAKNKLFYKESIDMLEKR